MDLTTFGIEDLSDEDVVLRFTISATALKGMLDKTSVVVSGKDFVPVLMNFCIQAASNSVRVLTSSLDIMMIVVTKNVTVDVEGKAFFPVRRLLEIATAAGDATLTIEARELSTRIEAVARSGARTTWALGLHSGIGYPAPPGLGELMMRQVPRVAFCEVVRAVSYAAPVPGPTGAHPALAQVSFAAGQALATDGVRLARTRFAADTLPVPFTLPIGAVDDVLRLLGPVGGQESFLLGQTDTHIVIQFGSDALVISRSAHDFPDTSSLTLAPAGWVEIPLHAQDVLAALKCVHVSLDIEAPLIGMAVTTEGVGIHSQDRYGNKSITQLPIKLLIPNPITLLFGYRYLLQLMQKFPDDDVVMMFDPKLKTKQTVFFRSKDESSLAVLPQAVAF